MEEKEEKIEETKNIEGQENKKRKKKSRKTNIITKILIVLIIIVVVCGIIELATGGISKVFNKIKYSYLRATGKAESTGNTIANIRNYGYSVTDGEYLYFMSPSENASTIGIYKVPLNDLSSDQTLLIQGVWEVLSLNYMDGYLYFITMSSPEDEDSEDTVDNRIYRMKIDGTEATIINNNEFNNECYEIYVVNNKIYYIGEDECIYYMDTDGNNRTKLNDDGCGYMGITENYIFYTNVTETESDEEVSEDTTSEDDTAEEDTTEKVTYIMNLDGTDKHAILEGQYLYNISVVGDYIYYQTDEGYISKVKIDGTESTLISTETAYSMVVCEEGIYYYNYYTVDGTTAGVAIYKMELDGSNVTLLKKLDGYSAFLCEFDNWLFFSEYDEDAGRFEVISKDGSQTILLYKLDFDTISGSSSTDEEDSDDENIEVLDEVNNENTIENTIITDVEVSE